MIILVHLWCVPEREREFRAYEDAALQIFRSYGGEVLEILRPDATLSSANAPHEIHLLRIALLDAWQAFRADEQLQLLAAERAACVARTQVLVCCPLQVLAP